MPRGPQCLLPSVPYPVASEASRHFIHKSEGALRVGIEAGRIDGLGSTLANARISSDCLARRSLPIKNRCSQIKWRMAPACRRLVFMNGESTTYETFSIGNVLQVIDSSLIKIYLRQAGALTRPSPHGGGTG